MPQKNSASNKTYPADQDARQSSILTEAIDLWTGTLLHCAFSHLESGVNMITRTPASRMKPGFITAVSLLAIVAWTLTALGAGELTMSVTACAYPQPCPGSSSLTVDEGEMVRYCFVITNTGDGAVLDVMLDVDFVGPGTMNAELQMWKFGLTDEDGDTELDDLAPGASITLPDDTWCWRMCEIGLGTCTAIVSGTDADSGNPVSDTDAVNVTVNALSFELAMEVTACLFPGSCPGTSPLTVDEGDAVRYCFVITNTGDGAILDVMLDVDFVGPGTMNAELQMWKLGLTDEDGDTELDDLAPGASIALPGDTWCWQMAESGVGTCTVTASGSEFCSGDLVSDTDVVTVTVNDLVAQLEISKTVCASPPCCPGSSTATVDEGDDVCYCYEVTNTGTAAALNIGVVDDNGTPGSAGDDLCVSLSGDFTDEDGDTYQDDLAPGATVSGSEIVTLSSPGTVMNTASVFGSDATSGGDLFDTDLVTVTVNDRVAALEITKTVCTSPPCCPGSSTATVDEGDDVCYCYEVTNTGTAAALNIGVVDDNGTPGSAGDDLCVSLSGDFTDEDGDTYQDDLAPGATVSGSEIVTLSSPGMVTNIAAVFGSDATSGGDLFDTDSVTVTVNDRVAALEITKTVCTSPPCCPGSSTATVDEGDDVCYCYEVTNTGTAAALNIGVVDDNGTPGSPGDDLCVSLSGDFTDEDGDTYHDDLAPGATVSGSAIVTLSSPGMVTNTATVFGSDATSGGDLSDTDSVTVTVNDRVAALQITKTVCTSPPCCPGSSTATVDEGDDVCYCYEVTNTGTAAALNIGVVDDNGTPGSPGDDFGVSLSGGFTDEDGDTYHDDLAPGASVSGSEIVTLSSPGMVTNTATVFGSDATSGGDLSDTDSVTVTVNDLVAALEIIKTVTTVHGSCPGSSSLTVDEWDTVKYCYTVTNTGDAAALNVQVIDDNGTPADGTDDFPVTLSGLTDVDADTMTDDLVPGASATGTVQVTLYAPGSITNTANADGLDGTSGAAVSDSDSVTVNVNDRVAELEITKTVTAVPGACPGSTLLTVDEGDTVKYCYTVKNTGDAAVLNIQMIDDNGTPADGTDDFAVPLTGLTDVDADTMTDDLAPGASATGTAQVTLFAPGSITNTANADGQDYTSGGAVSDSDSVTVTVTNTPPVIHDCPGDQYIPNPAKKPTVIVHWTPPTATDSSGVPPTLVSTQDPGESFPVGLTTVTYTATDAQGSTDMCSFEILVENYLPPVVEIQVPGDDAAYFVGEEILAKWNVTSNLDLASTQATTENGQPLDTSKGGNFRFRVAATDSTGLSTSKSVTWTVLYLLRPPAGADEWTEEWLWIDNVLPPNERMMIGSVPISGVYVSGNPITISFSLCDVDGHAIQDCVAMLSVTKVRDPEEDTPYKDLTDMMLKLYTFRYDRERGGYFFELQTFGYEPGYYDLWIAVNAVLQQRLRIQMLEP